MKLKTLKKLPFFNPIILGFAFLLALLFTFPFEDYFKQLIYGKPEKVYYDKYEYKKDYDDEEYKKYYEKNKSEIKRKIFNEKLKYYIWSFFNFFFVFYIFAVLNFHWLRISKTSSKLKFLTSVKLIFYNLIFMLFASFISSIPADLFFGWFGESAINTEQIYMRISKFVFINNIPMISAIVFAFIFSLYHKSRNTEIENMRLREEKMQAELISLKEQISPHFFFNTLSSLSSVIRTKEKEASLDFVENLSNVYRYILESNSSDLVTIREESEFLESYFYLLNKRFGEKVKLDMKLVGSIFENFIPPLALQICLENAVVHNKATIKEPLGITINSDENYIIIQNNIQKIEKSENYGFGLSNLSKRFKIIADKELMINKGNGSFKVKLPMIKK